MNTNAPELCALVGDFILRETPIGCPHTLTTPAQECREMIKEVGFKRPFAALVLKHQGFYCRLIYRAIIGSIFLPHIIAK